MRDDTVTKQNKKLPLARSKKQKNFFFKRRTLFFSLLAYIHIKKLNNKNKPRYHTYYLKTHEVLIKIKSAHERVISCGLASLIIITKTIKHTRTELVVYVLNNL